jgi:DNA adenine methylase
MRVAHPIPYQGSKRNIAEFILRFFPQEFDTLIEPFAGSAAISLAAACYGKVSRFHINDVNKPLMDLWHEIIHNPERISNNYENLWHEQQGREREFYDIVRDQFNKTKRPDCLLYLLARCVKASIRYNSEGEFNQSPDNRRKGRLPERMRSDIFAASGLLRGRTVITSKDYQEVLKSVSRRHLVYMDPPYQGICSSRDPRYYTGIDFGEFVQELKGLIGRRITFLLSYDGRKGRKVYGTGLPAEMGLYKVEIKAGRSTQSTFLGRNDITYESLYLSKELIEHLDISPGEVLSDSMPGEATQLMLPIVDEIQTYERLSEIA